MERGNQRGGQRNRGGYRGRNNRSFGGGGYVGAPYNFVPFSKDVYEYPDGKLTGHNRLSEELLSGEISYRITAHTPIIVDDGNDHFCRDLRGNYAIPGSTVRGLIRSNVQILGLSSFVDDIDDYALMYRKVAGAKGDPEKDRYASVLGAKIVNINTGKDKHQFSALVNVKAGYIAKESGRYLIYQTVTGPVKRELGEMNYYVLSERGIVEDYLAFKASKKDHFSYPAFLKNEKSIMQHEFQRFYREKIRGRVHYRGKPNKGYQPYMIPVSYKIVNLKDVAAVDKPGKYPTRGYAVSSGAMREKKAIYIVPEIDRSKESIPVPEADIAAFKIDYEKRKNTIRAQNKNCFFDLPEEGECKPVFYIQLGGRLYFGFTPRLRLFYDKTIKEGLKGRQAQSLTDYGKAMFGYTGEKGSYKSRLSFSDAVLEGSGKTLGDRKVLLAEPKPTSYLDYLAQPDEGRAVTYNDDFELRGVKQYWLREQEILDEKANDPRRKSVASVLRSLDAGSVFTGKVRFKNLSKDELGLLLWSIRLDEGCRMNVGKAKAFGYGNIEVEITGVNVLDCEKAYTSFDSLNLSPFVSVDVEEMIAAYKEHINAFLKEKKIGKIEDLPQIQDFFLMKSVDMMPQREDIRYMDIDNREYQSRTKRLPSVSEVVHRKK